MIRKFVQKILKIVSTDAPILLCLPLEDSDYDDTPISQQTIDIYKAISLERLYMFPTELSMHAAMDIQEAIYNFEKTKYKKNLAFLDILYKTDKLGFYPKGMSISSKDMLCLLSRYWTVIKNERHINIAEYHKYFNSEPLSIKFEMIAKDAVIHLDLLPPDDKNDENGKSLIHYATKWKNLSLLAHLLLNKWNANREDVDGNTPLFYTTGKHHKDGKTVKLLLQYGANPTFKNKKGQTYIDRAEQKHNMHSLHLISGRIMHV